MNDIQLVCAHGPLARVIAAGIPHQGRFSSFPVDESYLLAAARYMEMNPAHTRLAANVASWMEGFVEMLEYSLEQTLIREKPGPKGSGMK